MSTGETLEPGGAGPTLDDEVFYEVIDDERVEQAPMGANEVVFASRIVAAMVLHDPSRTSGVPIAEVLFRLRSKPSLQLRPDAAFVSAARWPKGRKIARGNFWDVVPDLVVEVVSPTNYAEEIPTKIRKYFEAGVRRAWVIYLNESLVYEYDSPRSIRILGREDTLEGGEVIPGFRLPLAELFEEDEVEEAGPA